MLSALPDPLDKSRLGRQPYHCFLSDTGIKQAIAEGIFGFDPAIPFDSKRFQPMSVDRRVVKVTDAMPLSDNYDLPRDWMEQPQTLLAEAISEVKFEDRLLLPYTGLAGIPLGPITEARSSLRRFGPSEMHSGGMYQMLYDGDYTEVVNITKNPIHHIDADHSLQTLVRVFPYFENPFYSPTEDTSFLTPHGADPAVKQLAEIVRSLEMGVSVSSDMEAALLFRKGYITTTSHFTVDERGLFYVHAADTAYRLRVFSEGLDFAKRKEYRKEDLLEPFSIRNGYTIRPNEHIIIDTMEELELSSHVALIFLDNQIAVPLPDSERSNTSSMRSAERNAAILNLIDGLVDPGYKGGFSRQPKTLTGRTIYPGDRIGVAIMVYFPNGTSRPYGSAELKSHYQGKKRISFS